MQTFARSLMLDHPDGVLFISTLLFLVTYGVLRLIHHELHKGGAWIHTAKALCLALDIFVPLGIGLCLVGGMGAAIAEQSMGFEILFFLVLLSGWIYAAIGWLKTGELVEHS
ncbi:MAG: hypothetical protein JWN89_18 [Parcubacteria group bacterium]|nr:hypothetical protein [Parcubacteria group bacterium]